MISADYLSEGSEVTMYTDGGAPHYHIQPRYKVLQSVDYVLKLGDTIYTLARDIFGENKDMLWTIIADLNPHKRVEEWEVGDRILLPTEVVERRNVVVDNSQ